MNFLGRYPRVVNVRRVLSKFRSFLSTRLQRRRVYAGLAGACVFALAVLVACDKGGSHHTPDSAVPTLVVPTTATAANTQTNPNAVWLAQDAAAVKLDSVGALLRSESVTTELTQITRDAETGAVWALGGNTLYFFQPSQAATSAVLTLPDPTAVTHLASVPRSDMLWIARGTSLSRVDKSGTASTPVTLKAPIKDLLAEGRHGTVWAATETGVTAYDGASGAEKNSLPLPAGASPQHIALDTSLDALWVATTDTLALYASDGTSDLAPFAQPGITHLASDGQGKVWLASASQIVSLDNSGAKLFALDLGTLFTAGSSLVGLAANPTDRSVWAATATQLVQIKADGTAGPITAIQGHINALTLFADAQAPKLSITLPGQGAYLNTPQPGITATLDEVGSGLDTSSAKLLLDGLAVPATCEVKTTNLICTPATALSEGGINVKLSARDFAGNSGESAAVFFTVDTIVPQITVSTPASGLLTNAATLLLSGTLSEAATLTLSTSPLTLDLNNAFSSSLTLAEGINTYTLSATDFAGNPAEQVLQITRDSIAPNPAPSNLLTVSAISNGNATVTGAANSAEAGAKVTITNTRTNVTVTVTVAAAGSFSALINNVQNGDVLKIVVNDTASNPSAPTNITAGSVEVPDPRTVAPPLDRTVATDIAASTAFLYTGANPIQTGVVAGTIEARRTAVLRGKVFTRDGAALSGVTVTILNHPEFGQTLSRADGMFDMVVNGGGLLTVNYVKAGFITAQRQANAPWRDFVIVPDVALIQLDSRVSAVDLTNTATAQVAQGNPVTDVDGARQATLLFPAGTQATMTLTNGSIISLTRFHIRATEFTVGPNGPTMMPATLPPSSGYTYEVEYSVDEAAAAGATHVSFSQPIISYTENFLGFPIGALVPYGEYDRKKGLWIARENGRVIKILSISQGLATLDLDGSGLAASASALAALGISNDEQQKLAALYPIGQSLWRVPIDHFLAIN